MPKILVECNFTLDEIKLIYETIYRAKAIIDDENWLGFDYPNYGGLPESVFKKFTSYQVDLLQELLDEKMPLSLEDIKRRLVMGLD